MYSDSERDNLPVIGVTRKYRLNREKKKQPDRDFCGRAVDVRDLHQLLVIVIPAVIVAADQLLDLIGGGERLS